jgi:hypothetical protein
MIYAPNAWFLPTILRMRPTAASHRILDKIGEHEKIALFPSTHHKTLNRLVLLETTVYDSHSEQATTRAKTAAAATKQSSAQC